MTVRAALLAASVLLSSGLARADEDAASRELARSIFKQLIEINTTDSVGNVTTASEAMAQRFRDAGFPESDIHILGATAKTKNLVVRLRGTGKQRPVLVIGHLDVVEAPRGDWSTDPFRLVVKDGYYYGRGTLDMKSVDAIDVATLIRLRNEGYRGDRDIILALTAGEESGIANGVDWLLRNHRELVDAEYALNGDDVGVYTEHGKPQFVQMIASEKLYADFELKVTDPGGHSSLPVPDNAIYRLAAGLGRLAKFEFPFELNAVTRTFYQRMAKRESGQRAADIRAILATPPDPAAIARLGAEPLDHSRTHTTCVATRLEGGHANNALPQMARAVVNCRILPGHSAEETRQTLIRVLADAKIAVRYIAQNGQILETAALAHGFAPPALRSDVMRALESVAESMWPGAPVMPTMAVGASDAVYTNAAGIPTYLVVGLAIEPDDDRSHGRDERLAVASFDRAVDFQYRFMKTLLTPR
jgi:acetylornithine deacetylase/succinyl-diaminopimelate desuccinylase-like protein